MRTVDRIAAAAIPLSVLYAVTVAATSWTWFPTPGDWGDIARIPGETASYVALLSPPALTLLYSVVRRRVLENGHRGGSRAHRSVPRRQNNAPANVRPNRR